MTPDAARDIALGAISANDAGTSDFDLNKGLTRPIPKDLRPAAVLFAIDVSQKDPSVLLTKRASHLKHHPGQIAFPGGKLDDADAGSPIVAGLREAREEIGLPPDNVEVLGTLPPHETVTNFQVTPVIGLVKEAFTIQTEPGEVEEAFRVPLSFLQVPSNYAVQWRIWNGEKRYYYVVPFGPYYIWGATARMLKSFADRVAVL